MDNIEFTELISSSKEYVLSAVNKFLQDRFYESLDDVVQETYLRAYKSLKKNGFRGDSKINTWLYTIARNESLRMNDKLLREELKKDKAFKTQEKYHLDEDFTKSETIAELIEKINKLPEHYKDVMILISQGFPMKDIALKLKIKSGTVKSRASRGRKLLETLYKTEEQNEKFRRFA